MSVADQASANHILPRDIDRRLPSLLRDELVERPGSLFTRRSACRKFGSAMGNRSSS